MGISAPVINNLNQGKPFILSGEKQDKAWLVFNTYDDGHGQNSSRFNN